MKVDNYSATLPTQDGHSVFDWLVESIPGDLADGIEVMDRLPTYNYAQSLGVKVDGDVLGVVRWGGNGDGTSIELKGAISHPTHGLLRSRWPQHRVTRIDVAVDRVAPGLFMRSYDAMRALAGEKRPRVTVDHEGDWTWRERPGLTAYFGSKQSDFRIALYEKDAEQLTKKGLPITDETRGWTRFELRCRPQKKPLAAMVAGLTPDEVVGLSPFGREALALFNGFEAAALKHPPRIRSEERTYMALLTQYGEFLRQHPDRMASLAHDLQQLDRFRKGKRLAGLLK